MKILDVLGEGVGPQTGRKRGVAELGGRSGTVPEDHGMGLGRGLWGREMDLDRRDARVARARAFPAMGCPVAGHSGRVRCSIGLDDAPRDPMPHPHGHNRSGGHCIGAHRSLCLRAESDVGVVRGYLASATLLISGAGAGEAGGKLGEK